MTVVQPKHAGLISENLNSGRVQYCAAVAEMVRRISSPAVSYLPEMVGDTSIAQSLDVRYVLSCNSLSEVNYELESNNNAINNNNGDSEVITEDDQVDGCMIPRAPEEDDLDVLEGSNDALSESKSVCGNNQLGGKNASSAEAVLDVDEQQHITMDWSTLEVVDTNATNNYNISSSKKVKKKDKHQPLLEASTSDKKKRKRDVIALSVPAAASSHLLSSSSKTDKNADANSNSASLKKKKKKKSVGGGGGDNKVDDIDDIFGGL